MRHPDGLVGAVIYEIYGQRVFYGRGIHPVEPGVHLVRVWPEEDINDRAQLILRSTGQFSQGALFSQEKLAIGGVNTVRGYPENTLVRDNGVTATVEVQLPVFGYQQDPNPRNLVVAPFADYGISWDDEDTSPGSVDRDSDTKRWIASLGLGLLWNPLEGLDAQVYWGADIADNFNDDDPRDLRNDDDFQDDGIHFSLSYLARS